MKGVILFRIPYCTGDDIAEYIVKLLTVNKDLLGELYEEISPRLNIEIIKNAEDRFVYPSRKLPEVEPELDEITNKFGEAMLC